MDFTTKIDIPASEFNINHQSRIMMLGSCFAENIGNAFRSGKFNIDINPFGILYNPASIAKSLEILIERKLYSESDIFFYKNYYHSYDHHSSFSDNDPMVCLNRINSRLQIAIRNIDELDTLIITFGTSYVYELRENKSVVGNCHKLPASVFDRYRLGVDDIVNVWTKLLDKYLAQNPSVRIIFTVSPIRHMKDGAHENQLSKSTLLLAIDKLCVEFANVSYFPSYEIVLDELRDYRFYAEDMNHPSPVAVEYIWERFGETYFTAETQQIMKQWNKIRAAMLHRPFDDSGDDYKMFLDKLIYNIKYFQSKYPYIYCSNELTEIEGRLRKIKK